MTFYSLVINDGYIDSTYSSIQKRVILIVGNIRSASSEDVAHCLIPRAIQTSRGRYVLTLQVHVVVIVDVSLT